MLEICLQGKGIPACPLKASISYIAASLTHFFNLVISAGIIPSDWKSARVTLFKADLRFDPNNYRPISVLSVIAGTVVTAFRKLRT